MILLVASLVVLVAGPLLYRLARRTPAALSGIDGFVLVAIGGLVLLEVMPHAVKHAGWIAIVAALIGLLGPGLLERWLNRAANKMHAATLALTLVGLAVHAALDGMALAGPQSGANATLALAVVLHRLPVGLTIWWLLRPKYGTNVGVAALALIAVATGAGYVSSTATVAAFASAELAVFQALVAGTLMHVVVHCPQPMNYSPRPGRWHLHAGLGAVLAVALLSGLSELDLHVHHHVVDGHHTIGAHAAFLVLARESALALVIAYFAAGMIHSFMPRATARWMGRGSAASQSLRGVVFGLPLPVCSCGVIPLYRTLVTRGVPATAAMAFLVATPEIGIDAVLLSIPLLGGELTLARVLSAAVVAISSGWIMGRVIARAGAEAPVSESAAVDGVEGSVRERFVEGLRVGLGEVVDNTAPWIVLGLGVAAACSGLLEEGWLAMLPLGLDVVFFAILGMPVYVCASGATPLVAMLIYKGVSPGAALAFLLTGPATNVTTFGVLSQLHGRRVAATFGATVAAFAIAIGYAVNFVMPAAQPLALHEAAHHPTDPVGMASLIVLAAIFLASLLRQGPRRFIGQVLTSAVESHDHGHSHDHDHSHSHEHAEPAHGGSCCHNEAASAPIEGAAVKS